MGGWGAAPGASGGGGGGGGAPTGTPAAVPFYGGDSALTEDPTNFNYIVGTGVLEVGAIGIGTPTLPGGSQLVVDGGTTTGVIFGSQATNNSATTFQLLSRTSGGTNFTASINATAVPGLNIASGSGGLALNFNASGQARFNGLAAASPNAGLGIQVDDGDAIDCLELTQDDVSENFINFDSTEAANTTNPLSSLTTPGAVSGFGRVAINGTAQWVAFYDAPS